MTGGAAGSRMTGGAIGSGVSGGAARRKMTKKKSPVLRDVQRRFGASILPGARSTSGPADLLNSQGGSPGAERLSVYAGGYVARIREAIGETFEAVRCAIGEDAFSVLAAEYSGRFGYEHYNLNHAGIHFQKFLKKSSLVARYPYLPELARFEWEVWQAFHAFDVEPMKSEELAGIPLKKWEKARVVFQPSVRIVVSAWPVIDLWMAKNDAAADFAAISVRGAQTALVGRKGDQVRCEALDPARAVLLDALMKGRLLGAACGILAKQNGDEEIPIAVWFANWIGDGLIQACRFESSSPARLRRARKRRSSSAALAGKQK